MHFHYLADGLAMNVLRWMGFLKVFGVHQGPLSWGLFLHRSMLLDHGGSGHNASFEFGLQQKKEAQQREEFLSAHLKLVIVLRFVS